MQPINHIEEIKILNTWGFASNPLNRLFNDIEQVFTYSELINTQRTDLNYPIDGLVVKIDNNVFRQKLSVIGKTPRGWCAIKFSPQEVTTQIKSITYQLGRTGKITPVAELSPVALQGTTVSRATLHNIAEIKKYDIHFQDTVIVRKAGDIIPEIIDILPNLRVFGSQQVQIPTQCPSCNKALSFNNTNIDLYCTNHEECPAQIVLRLSYFSSRQIANINGLSDKTIDKLREYMPINNIASLYDLDYNIIGNKHGFGDKSIDSLKQNIDLARQISDWKLIAGLSINGIGIENAKTLAEIISNRDSFDKT
jgi:DNA ligase (NAD+)